MDLLIFITGIAIGGTIILIIMCSFNMNSSIDYEEKIRNIRKSYWLNREEANILKKKSKQAGLNEGEFVRQLLVGAELKEQPSPEFYSFLKELRAIGNNINQIARRVNYDGKINKEYLNNEIINLNEFMSYMKKTFM